MNGGQRHCETGDSDVPDGDSVDEQPGSQRGTTATTDADECARQSSPTRPKYQTQITELRKQAQNTEK